MVADAIAEAQREMVKEEPVEAATVPGPEDGQRRARKVRSQRPVTAEEMSRAAGDEGEEAPSPAERPHKRLRVKAAAPEAGGSEERTATTGEPEAAAARGEEVP
jgi:hypothetical protein